MLFLDRLFKKNMLSVDSSKLPVHIAIIMDGNGRWAKKRRLSRSIGHREGSNTLKKIASFCNDIGIKYLTVYAFSTENWKRPKNEVDALMTLLLEYLKNAEKELADKNIRLNVIGDTKRLPHDIQEQIKKVISLTQNNNGMIMNIALNYGGRDEIIFAVKKILKDAFEGKVRINDINDKTISDRLYTAGMPDPDLLIRTSGEKRLSNFLLWQCAYTEFWYTDVLWPDFRKEHLMEAIKVYQSRNRRFGGI